MIKAARFFVSGRVQGVFFRASTLRQAQALQVRGYARNLADGRVEVLAVGDTDALRRLELWLQHGPQLAKVESVTQESAGPDEAGADFTSE